MVRGHASYYNEDRPHMSLDGDAPITRGRAEDVREGRSASQSRRSASPVREEGGVTARPRPTDAFLAITVPPMPAVQWQEYLEERFVEAIAQHDETSGA